MSKAITAGATALFACVLCATPLSLRLLPDGKMSLSVDSASAVIGRPLTPMSVAGVHRRAERRAYRRGYYGYRAYNNPYRYGYGYTYGAYQQPYSYTGYGYAASRPWSGYGYAYQPWFGGSSAYPYQSPWWAR